MSEQLHKDQMIFVSHVINLNSQYFTPTQILLQFDFSSKPIHKCFKGSKQFNLTQ